MVFSVLLSLPLKKSGLITLMVFRLAHNMILHKTIKHIAVLTWSSVAAFIC